MLTNAAVKAARPRAAAYKVSDNGGLFLHVAPTGTKSWRWRFSWGGREQLLTIGAWPEISLDAARAQRDQARAQRAQGIDPREARRADRAADTTFEPIARAWHAKMVKGWTAVHAGDVLASLERDIFPAIGAMPIAAITTPVANTALRAIEERGAIATAQRVAQRLSAVFVYAINEGLIESNPAAFASKALSAVPPADPQPAIVDVEQLLKLGRAVDQLTAAPAAKLASRFLALTAVRLDAVRGARWCEIEDLDSDAPLWRVPAARVKLRKAKKIAANDHLVPLSAAAVAVLRAARDLHRLDANLQDALIFPGRSGTAPIGEAAIGALYDRAGYGGRHVPHGWRAAFSTIMNERRPGERDAIDQALGHVLKKEDGSVAKVEGAYNRSQHLDARRALFDAWGEILAG